jgi:arogenate/prephenate dehydratase
MGAGPSAPSGKRTGVARAVAPTTTTTTTDAAAAPDPPVAVAAARAPTSAPGPPPSPFPAPLTTARVAAATGTTVAALTASASGSAAANGGSGPPRVAYQGVPGAYSERAAAAAVPGADPLPCAQFEVAFQALSQWLADTAVLPIENSAGGSVHAVYDLLLRYASLHLTGELELAVSHCLLAPPGTRLEDVHTVASHPQALAQCEGYLRRLGAARAGGPIVREAADDTAGAARDLARSPRPGVAAIASERAAALYGLTVLDAGIQDAAVNVTRFLVLGREPARPSPAAGVDGSVDGGSGGSGGPTTSAGLTKTSVAFSLPDGPGQLFKALSVFALRGIDLTKIESRPARGECFGGEGGEG